MIDIFFYKLNKLKHNQNKTIVLITNKIINIIKRKDLSVNSSKKLSTFTNVSLSMLTKYTKLMGYTNINEVLFLIKESILQEGKRISINQNKIYTQIAKYIWNCRKIQFIGGGNAYITNNDFKSKLDRLDLWTSQSGSKYEEEGFVNLLNKKDLIIINSTTMQHEYITRIIKKQKCQILLITANKNIKPTNNVWTLTYETDNFEGRFDRYYTIKSRNSVLEIFDNIFTEIMKIDGAIELLKLSRYK